MDNKLAETWLDHLEQVKDAKRRISDYHYARTGDSNIQRVVEREVAGEMVSELQEIQGKVEKKLLKEINSFSLEDLKGIKITEVERSVMEERMKTSNYAEIDRRLNLVSNTAFNTYVRIMNKIKGNKTCKKELIKIKLSEGKTYKQIADDVGSTVAAVRKEACLLRKH